MEYGGIYKINITSDEVSTIYRAFGSTRPINIFDCECISPVFEIFKGISDNKDILLTFAQMKILCNQIGSYTTWSVYRNIGHHSLSRGDFDCGISIMKKLYNAKEISDDDSTEDANE